MRQIGHAYGWISYCLFVSPFHFRYILPALCASFYFLPTSPLGHYAVVTRARSSSRKCGRKYGTSWVLPVFPSIRCASLVGYCCYRCCFFSFRSLISNGSSAGFFAKGSGNPKIHKNLAPTTSHTLNKNISSVLNESYTNLDSRLQITTNRFRWYILI